MIVDSGRNARKTIMYFFAPPDPIPAGRLSAEQPDQAELLSHSFGLFSATRHATRVRWYEAPPGAKKLPFPTSFALSDFLSKWERVQVEYGEDPFYRWQWDNGQPPQGATGQSYCGTPEDFLIPKKWSADLPTLMRGPTGLPCCCASVVCAAFVMTAIPVIEDVTGIGLSGDVLHTLCPGTEFQTLLPVLLNSDDFPELDGLKLDLPVTGMGGSVEYVLERISAGRTLQLSIQAYKAGAVEFILWNMVYWFADPAYTFPTGLPATGSVTPTAAEESIGLDFMPIEYYEIGQFATSWLCGPLRFTETAELLSYPEATPSGKFITITVN